MCRVAIDNRGRLTSHGQGVVLVPAIPCVPCKQRLTRDDNEHTAGNPD